jgi:hypothetical protein
LFGKKIKTSPKHAHRWSRHLQRPNLSGTPSLFSQIMPYPCVKGGITYRILDSFQPSLPHHKVILDGVPGGPLAHPFFFSPSPPWPSSKPSPSFTSLPSSTTVCRGSLVDQIGKTMTPRRCHFFEKRHFITQRFDVIHPASA